jgi:8-oxo-dGTP pyrophosphatase MutT (NUDIX family)
LSQEAPTEVPVVDGATVVVARDGADGLEVLLLQRTPAAVFAPGVHCFPGGRVDPDDGGDHRVAAVREAEEEAGLRLDPEALRFVARWVTPPGSPRRFDTSFYVAPAPPGQEAVADGVEMVASGWFRPADALTAPIELIEPTANTLALLAGFPTVDHVLAALDAADPADLVQQAPLGWRVRL